MSREKMINCKLMGIPELMQDYGFGREFAGRFVEAMPHIGMGTVGLGPRRLVRREDVEQVIARAARGRVDLFKLVMQNDADKIFDRWLTPILPAPSVAEAQEASE